MKEVGRLDLFRRDSGSDAPVEDTLESHRRLGAEPFVMRFEAGRSVRKPGPIITSKSLAAARNSDGMR